MRRQTRTVAFLMGTVLALASPAAADVVADWNLIALPSIAAGRGPTPAQVIDLAMVHLAMHDAAQAYDQRFESFAGSIPGASGSASVAVAKAAHDVLAARFPAQAGTLATSYANWLAALVPPPSPAEIADGEQIGAQAAQNVILARSGDGSFPAVFEQFTGGTLPGQWHPNAGTPGMVSPWAADVTPFAIETVQRCQADAVPLLTSVEYADAYNEVKRFGSATGSVRTAAQSAVAKTFSGNFLTQYNRVLRDIAAAHLAGDDLAGLGNRARLFALTNVAMADAFICAWHTKKQFDFWRPSDAIRRGDEDGNPLTQPDPLWTTYFARNPNIAQNPNYPDYTSGANNLTGAMTRMLALFFGSDKPFSFAVYAAAPAVPLTPGVDPDPRIYKKFSDVAKDVIDARVYLGIHFRFADTEARSQGRRVAGHTFRNLLRPLD